MLKSGNPPLADFLEWLGNRFINIHREHPDVDFVQACFRHATEIRGTVAP